MQSQQVEDKQSSDIVHAREYIIWEGRLAQLLYRHETDMTSLKCQGTSMRIHG